MIPELSSLAARVRGFIAGCKSGHASSDESFERLALDLFALQFRHVAPYRRLCEARGVTPETVRHWSGIPAVPTAAFKEFEMSSLTPTERTHCFLSSGTTGQMPSRHFHSAESLALYEVSLVAWWRANVKVNARKEKGRLLMLTPPPEAAPHSSLVHMLSTLSREFGTEDSLFAGGMDAEGRWVVDADAAVQCLSGHAQPRSRRREEAD